MTQLAIDSDLRALGDQSERAMPDFAEIAARLAGGGSPYRDDRPGAEARRRALVEDRMVELALLPLGFERVYVHRVSRAAAGGAALLAAVAMMVAVLDPWTGQVMMMLSGMPLPVFAPVLVGFAALVAYILAGLIAERHYERRLRASVRPGAELYGDIDRLEAARPLDDVRRMVARVDAVSTALPLLGATLGIALCGFLMAFTFLPAHILDDVAMGSVGQLVLVTVLAGWFAFDLGRACWRERRSPSRPVLLTLVEHWGTLVAGGLIGSFVLWYGARLVNGVRFLGAVPGDGKRLVLIATAVAAVLVPLAWGLVQLRRREEKRLMPGES